jgi:hypothetical protein
MGDGLEITIFGLITAKASGSLAILALTTNVVLVLGYRLIALRWGRR